MRQRQPGNLIAVDGEVLGRHRHEFGIGPVHGRRPAHVERRDRAPGEIIIHLHADGFQRAIGRGGGVAERQDGLVGFGPGPPVRVGLGFLEERVEFGLADAEFAAAVGFAAETGDDVVDHLFRVGVRGGVGRHDAVPVELGLREDFRRVGGVGEGDGRGVGLAQIVQDAPGAGEEFGAGIGLVVDGGQGQGFVALGQVIRIAKLLRGPLDGGEEFGGPDPSILVGVDEVERLGVEFDAARGATEGHPQFLVELFDVRDVPAVAEHHLVKSAGAEELP